MMYISDFKCNNDFVFENTYNLVIYILKTKNISGIHQELILIFKYVFDFMDGDQEP